MFPAYPLIFSDGSLIYIVFAFAQCKRTPYVGKPKTQHKTAFTVADLRGPLGTRLPLGPNSFIFVQFLGKIGLNNRLTPPPVLEILDPPLI